MSTSSSAVNATSSVLEAILPYVQACVQTLSTPTQVAKQPHAAISCLWISFDQVDCEQLQSRLTAQATFTTLSDLAKQSVLTRHPLACFWLPTLSLEHIERYLPLLMRFRDLYAEYLLVVMDADIDLRPYGLTPLETFDDIADAPILWQFNLYDYKQLPDWLNSRFWANPENWGVHRW